MAEQPPAVYVSHPPEGLLRAFNPTLKLLLRTPIAGPLRKQFMVLNFTGRKSGRAYSIPLSAHHIDGDLYALSSAGWTKNFGSGHRVDVLHNGKTAAMRGELVTDPAVVSDLQHRAAESYGVKQAQRVMGVAFRDPRIPTVDEFREAVEREKIVAVKLTPA
jgi:hypothetical protein